MSNFCEMLISGNIDFYIYTYIQLNENTTMLFVAFLSIHITKCIILKMSFSLTDLYM